MNYDADLAHGAAVVSLVGALSLGDLRRSLQGVVIDGLEYFAVQLPGLYKSTVFDKNV